MPSATAVLTEHSFFFTHKERDRIAGLAVKSYQSVVARMLGKALYFVSCLIPETVAPNSIALLGVVLSMQAFQVVQQYYRPEDETAAQSQTAAGVSGLLLLGSSMCSALDGVHARRCRSTTFLGTYFSEI